MGESQFRWQGLGAATLGGAVAGSFGGAGVALVDQFASGLMRPVAKVGVSLVAGAAGSAASSLVECGSFPSTGRVVSGAAVGGLGEYAGAELSPQRGFKISTIKGLVSGSPNSNRVWGAGFYAGLVGVAADTLGGGGLGKSCK